MKTHSGNLERVINKKRNQKLLVIKSILILFFVGLSNISNTASLKMSETVVQNQDPSNYKKGMCVGNTFLVVDRYTIESINLAENFKRVFRNEISTKLSSNGIFLAYYPKDTDGFEHPNKYGKLGHEIGVIGENGKLAWKLTLPHKVRGGIISYGSFYVQDISNDGNKIVEYVSRHLQVYDRKLDCISKIPLTKVNAQNCGFPPKFVGNNKCILSLSGVNKIQYLCIVNIENSDIEIIDTPKGYILGCEYVPNENSVYVSYHTARYQSTILKYDLVNSKSITVGSIGDTVRPILTNSGLLYVGNINVYEMSDNGQGLNKLEIQNQRIINVTCDSNNLLVYTRMNTISQYGIHIFDLSSKGKYKQLGNIELDAALINGTYIKNNKVITSSQKGIKTYEIIK